jgi:hypothetical protein
VLRCACVALRRRAALQSSVASAAPRRRRRTRLPRRARDPRSERRIPRDVPVPRGGSPRAQPSSRPFARRSVGIRPVTHAYQGWPPYCDINAGITSRRRRGAAQTPRPAIKGAAAPTGASAMPAVPAIAVAAPSGLSPATNHPRPVPRTH